MSITDEQWYRAVKEVEDNWFDYEDLWPEERPFSLYDIEMLLIRYNQGERTEHLYNDLLKVS